MDVPDPLGALTRRLEPEGWTRFVGAGVLRCVGTRCGLPGARRPRRLVDLEAGAVAFVRAAATPWPIGPALGARTSMRCERCSTELQVLFVAVDPGAGISTFPTSQA